MSRFGHKCTYAHDNDVKATLQRKEENTDATPKPSETTTTTTTTTKQPMPEDYDESAVITSTTKKKRPGVKVTIFATGSKTKEAEMFVHSQSLFRQVLRLIYT